MKNFELSKYEEINKLLQTAEESIKNNSSNSLNLCNQALSESQKSGYLAGKAKSFELFGKYFEVNKNYDFAIENYKRSLNIWEQAGEKEEIAKILNTLGIAYYSKGNFTEAETLYQKALSMRSEYQNKEGLLAVYNNLALLYARMANYEKSLEFSLQALSIAETQDDIEQLAKAIDFVALNYYNLGKYKNSLEYYLRELKLYEGYEKVNENTILDIYFNIGKIYFALQDNDNALKYYQKALYFADKNQEEAKIAKIYSGIGSVYFELKNFDASLEFFNNALKIAEKNNNKLGQALLLNNIGLVYKNKGDLPKALDFCKRSLAIKNEMNIKEDLFFPITSIAEIQLKLGNIDEALIYANKALDIAEKEDQLKFLRDSYFLLFEIKQRKGNYAESLIYYQRYVSARDSLTSEEIRKMIAELNIKYETEKKETENNLLKRSKQIQFFLFLVLSGLILVLLFIVINRYRVKARSNKILKEMNDKIQRQHKELEDLIAQLKQKEEILVEANATKDKFFSIIAHDLKNPLQAITLSSEILVNNITYMTNEQLLNLSNNIHKAGSHISNLLDNLLQWSRSQLGRIEFKPTYVNLEKIIDDNINLLRENAFKKNIIIDKDLLGIEKVYGDQNMISTIIRNLLSNAIKFTPENGIITISAEMGRDSIKISVRDNGIGIDKENINKLFRIDTSFTTNGTSNESGTGLGLILCKEFVEKHKGKIWAESSEGKGTTFSFTLPYQSN